MEDKILCPLIDSKITPVDCMENRDLKEESIPSKYKQKENWKKICNECKYSKF
ncbi:MAG: hypothetical protein J6B23_10105 [Clostridia bacterium]|nr:hypothetical protein [Clostridia bacterium]